MNRRYLLAGVATGLLGCLPHAAVTAAPQEGSAGTRQSGANAQGAQGGQGSQGAEGTQRRQGSQAAQGSQSQRSQSQAGQGAQGSQDSSAMVEVFEGTYQIVRGMSGMERLPQDQTEGSVVIIHDGQFRIVDKDQSEIYSATFELQPLTGGRQGATGAASATGTQANSDQDQIFGEYVEQSGQGGQSGQQSGQSGQGGQSGQSQGGLTDSGSAESAQVFRITMRASQTGPQGQSGAQGQSDSQGQAGAQGQSGAQGLSQAFAQKQEVQGLIGKKGQQVKLIYAVPTGTAAQSSARQGAAGQSGSAQGSSAESASAQGGTQTPMSFEPAENMNVFVLTQVQQGDPGQPQPQQQRPAQTQDQQRQRQSGQSGQSSGAGSTSGGAGGTSGGAGDTSGGGVPTGGSGSGSGGTDNNG